MKMIGLQGRVFAKYDNIMGMEEIIPKLKWKEENNYAAGQYSDSALHQPFDPLKLL